QPARLERFEARAPRTQYCSGVAQEMLADREAHCKVLGAVSLATAELAMAELSSPKFSPTPSSVLPSCLILYYRIQSPSARRSPQQCRQLAISANPSGRIASTPSTPFPAHT